MPTWCPICRSAAAPKELFCPTHLRQRRAAKEKRAARRLAQAQVTMATKNWSNAPREDLSDVQVYAAMMRENPKWVARELIG